MIFYKAIDERGWHILLDTKEAAAAIDKNFEKIDFPAEKKSEAKKFLQGLYDQLNERAPAPAAPAKPAKAEPTYAAKSIAIEDAWDDLPMSQKLHFAAKAMEEARELLYPPHEKPRWGSK